MLTERNQTSKEDGNNSPVFFSRKPEILCVNFTVMAEEVALNTIDGHRLHTSPLLIEIGWAEQSFGIQSLKVDNPQSFRVGVAYGTWFHRNVTFSHLWSVRIREKT